MEGRLEDAEESIGYLKTTREDLVYDFISGYLCHLFGSLEFNDSERVSLYLHDAPRSRFVLAGRFSKNSYFSKTNRKAFPETEGCIGQTWSNGGEYFVELPQDNAGRFKYLKKKWHFY
ncbi:hypothetical protein EII20_06650 [Comamonadaceae bacterium OH2545_COT-014]|nr:hypothetical protein EII20_06650 [Comamonadaceae bacterium OH2545_COT-014]